MNGRRDGRRRLRVSVALVVALSAWGPSSVDAAPCWLPPVEGVVVDPFRLPACPWCPGNRGLEYSVEGRVPVVAVAAGTVTYSGSIAGTRYVVVQHADGWRTTYGKLVSTELSIGDRVLSRRAIGVASGEFYFGVRIGDDYVDPARYLGHLVGRPRLIPTDGTPPRPAPPPRLRCGTPAPAR